MEGGGTGKGEEKSMGGEEERGRRVEMRKEEEEGEKKGGGGGGGNWLGANIPDGEQGDALIRFRMRNFGIDYKGHFGHSWGASR